MIILIVRYVRKDEERYYEELLEYSRVHLMLYPYHLSDVIVRGLRMTPFQYYSISLINNGHLLIIVLNSYFIPLF